MTSFFDLDRKYNAQNYHPYPVVFSHGKGVMLWDVEGNEYYDMMSAYSAVSYGHSHPKLLKALQQQAQELCLVARSYYNDQLPLFLKKACDLYRYDKGLPMNSGTEAVETAIKAARKWGYQVKKIPENAAEIIVCEGNFHGRTTTVVSFSTEDLYRRGFGPYTPGFKIVPFGDHDALERAMTKNTAAFLFEPIQGEGGIKIPPNGYLKKCAEICQKHNVLLLADEIQTGMGRTGKLLACDHEGIKPDGVMLGKALGGGILPVSLFLAKNEVMDVFSEGTHGSTFGGNSLAAAVGSCALDLLVEEKLTENAAELGEYFLAKLKGLKSPYIKEIRGKGLLIGIEINPSVISGKELCKRLLKKGIVTKETHEVVIRFAPPLIITKDQIDAVFERIREVFESY